MKNLKRKKYSILSIISKFSFVFVFMFASLVSLVWAANPSVSVTNITYNGAIFNISGLDISKINSTTNYNIKVSEANSAHYYIDQNISVSSNGSAVITATNLDPSKNYNAKIILETTDLFGNVYAESNFTTPAYVAPKSSSSTLNSGTPAVNTTNPANPANPGVTVNAGIKNPLGDSLDTIPKFIEAIINIVLVVGIPILALAIIYAGFLYVKAQGNPSELEIAHRTLLYTVIGGALLLGAYVIAQAIGATVKDITNGA